MKARILVITAFLFLYVNSLFSQCISVELSVTWKMGHDIFKKDSIVSIPILNITYHNNCDTNYYFFKVSPRKDGTPMILFPASLNSQDNDDLGRAKRHRNYVNQNFNVIIGSEPLYNAYWVIFSDTIDYHKEFSFEGVGLDLNNIYDFIYPEHYKNYKKMPAYFIPSDATPDTIISGSINDQFVFLKPGEIHIDTYNLIGYKMVEGCFTFLIDKDAIENYVLTYGRMGYEKIELPAIVGEYQLFSGAFNTNKVTVCFGGK